MKIRHGRTEDMQPDGLYQKDHPVNFVCSIEKSLSKIGEKCLTYGFFAPYNKKAHVICKDCDGDSKLRAVPGGIRPRELRKTPNGERENERFREPGAGGSPAQVVAAEHHSGVSFLKSVKVGEDGIPTVKRDMYRRFMPVQCNRWCECV